MAKSVEYERMGERLRARRRALGMTQEMLAECADISTSFIGHLERAEKIPSLDTVAALCTALDISMDELALGRKNTRCDRKDCPLYEAILELMEDYRA